MTARPDRYSCRGWASYDGPCGADDCLTCYPSRRESPEEVANLSRLQDSGYELTDGEWWKDVGTRTHTARKPHHGILPGQRYRVRTWRVVDDRTGKSEHRHVYACIAQAAS